MCFFISLLYFFALGRRLCRRLAHRTITNNKNIFLSMIARTGPPPLPASCPPHLLQCHYKRLRVHIALPYKPVTFFMQSYFFRLFSLSLIGIGLYIFINFYFYIIGIELRVTGYGFQRHSPIEFIRKFIFYFFYKYSRRLLLKP